MRWIPTFVALIASLGTAAAEPLAAFLPVHVSGANPTLGHGVRHLLIESLRDCRGTAFFTKYQVDYVIGASHIGPQPDEAAALHVAEICGGDTAITGALTVTGGNCRLELKLSGAATGDVTAEDASLSACINDAGRKLAAQLGSPVPSGWQAVANDAALQAFAQGADLDENSDTYDRAIAAYRQAAQLDPRLAPALKSAGHLLKEQGDTTAARDLFRQALQVLPAYSMARFNLGVTLAEAGDTEGAESAYQRVIDQNTDRVAVAYATNSLGNLHRQGSEWQQALLFLERAARLLPKYAMPLANEAYIFSAHGESSTARHLLDDAISLNNDRWAVSYAYRLLGDMQRRANRPDDAISAYRQSLAVAPDGGWTYLNLGVTLKSQGRFDEAVSAYESALRVSRETTLDAYAHTNLGRLLLQMGHRDAAAAHLRQALRLMPDLAPARSALAELEKQGK